MNSEDELQYYIDDNNNIDLMAQIVLAYVSSNAVPAGELAKLIASVHAALEKLGVPEEPPRKPQKPAVDPRRSVHNDYIICLEDGLQFVSLKRHLMTQHNMTPDQYRAKWSLSADYPMVAPSYSAKRSQLAKQLRLGRKPAPSKNSDTKPGNKLSPRGRRGKLTDD
ncbi:putative transcriptional regulator [Mesorhizobium soli]|uniref:MucR family transcriptional regulator n=1 Tax=Pseudaminobacter soli (ex Li et al. 2025) TaxID=1295366 RepID=UPI00247672A0|nr:MucR family transcriptional regulator [Mesorhizobium soli]MDH6232161.1 putative transcriptional regulator [Mesorhizobium soli]